MNFNDLFDKGVDAYCQHAFEPKGLLFYVHIPKCSGTSSVNHLIKVFERSWHFAYDKIREDAVDLYPYLRDMYEQKRDKEIEE